MLIAERTHVCSDGTQIRFRALTLAEIEGMENVKSRSVEIGDSFFWGNRGAYITRLHAVGGKVSHQIGSVAAAHEAARAGVDVIVAQGVEAGAAWLGKSQRWHWCHASWTPWPPSRSSRLAASPAGSSQS